MTVRRIRDAWYVDVKFTHADGRVERVRKRSPVQTKAGATKYELQVRAALLEGTYAAAPAPVVAGAPTLADYVASDYLPYCATNNRPRWAREKAAMFRRAVLPVLGALQLDAIGVRELERYKAARAAAGLSAKTVNDETALVIAVLRHAVKYKVAGVVVPDVDKIKTRAGEFDFLAFDESDRLIAAAGDDAYGMMIKLGLRTGLRRGELRALRWQDVDLVAGRLQVWYAADDRNALHAPKSGKARMVPLSDDAARWLREHRHLRGQFVFCNENGSMVTTRQQDRPLERACKRAGLRLVGWHALRHTFASHLVMRGVPLKTIQELLGHATIAMTMRYAHLSPDVKRDAVRLLDGRTTTAKKAEEA